MLARALLKKQKIKRMRRIHQLMMQMLKKKTSSRKMTILHQSKYCNDEHLITLNL